jgi:hypothetical protein
VELISNFLFMVSPNGFILYLYVFITDWLV